MRPALASVVVALTAAPAGAAAPPAVSIQVSAAEGAAPFQVTLTATGDAASYRWDLGDGATADGGSVMHTYNAGRYRVVLHAVSATGEETVASTAVTADGLTFAAPERARFARRTTFRGALIPPQPGRVVVVTAPTGRAIARAKTKRDGSYVARGKVRAAGDYRAATGTVTSVADAVRLIPALRLRVVGSRARGAPLFVAASVRPAQAGTLALRITRRSARVIDAQYRHAVRIRLSTRRVTAYRIRAEVLPDDGYGGIARALTVRVVLPRLAYGTRSSAVAQLAGRLRALHYAAPAAATFDGRLLDAVYAFQKVQGLPRTGSVDARFWQRLDTAVVPMPRYAHPSSHLEVNKPRQVLYVVRGSRVALIVPISTAGLPGTFTPVGRFGIYRKVVGFDPSPLGTLYDPMYFTGGYAIHGNPSVPPYPASHGCVRVPMWIAPLLFATNPYGETVYVY